MGMPQKLWISLQGYLFPIMTTSLVTLGWQFYLHPQHILRTKNYAEAAALVVRLALWSVFITPYFGLLGSMGVYLAYTWIASNYIFINFAVSHTHLPVVEKADTQVSYAAGLIINTSNHNFRCTCYWTHTYTHVHTLAYTLLNFVSLAHVLTSLSLHTGWLGEICRHPYDERGTRTLEVRRLVDELPKLPGMSCHLLFNLSHYLSSPLVFISSPPSLPLFSTSITSSL